MNAKPNETPQQQTRQSRTDVLHDRRQYDCATDDCTTVRQAHAVCNV